MSNAARNPRRTASTAAALMIGLALVSAFGVLGASTKASTDAVVDDVIKADFLISGSNFRPFTPEVAAAVEAVPGIDVVSPIRVAPARVEGEITAIAGVDPATVEQVLNIPVTAGSVAALSGGGLAVDDQQAKDLGYALGTPVEVTFTSGPVTLARGRCLHQELGALRLRDLPRHAHRVGTPPLDQQVYLKAAPGTDAGSLRPAIDEALKPFPDGHRAGPDRVQGPDPRAGEPAART